MMIRDQRWCQSRDLVYLISDIMSTCLAEARMLTLTNMCDTRIIESNDETFREARNFGVSFCHCWTYANVCSWMTNDTFYCRKKVGVLIGLTMVCIIMCHKSSCCWGCPRVLCILGQLCQSGHVTLVAAVGGLSTPLQHDGERCPCQCSWGHQTTEVVWTNFLVMARHVMLGELISQILQSPGAQITRKLLNLGNHRCQCKGHV